MASGNKELIAQTLERLVSGDTNRMQKFRNADSAEFFRAMMDTLQASDDLSAAAIAAPVVTMNNPVNAEIMSGLMVQPQIASLNLLVQPGVAYFLAPDGAPDDSPYKYVNDQGILVQGVLAMQPNSSGFTRIDVIECQWQENTQAETDNRDIFNPATGSFTPTTVAKAQQGQLTYRIRVGTPFGGFPGTALGWLPLAVASVPTSTSNNDTITFWDVRPMVSSRIVQPFNTYKSFSKAKLYGKVDSTTNPGASVLTGTVEANTFASYTRLGGVLQRGTPGVDYPGLVDLQDVANQSTAIVPSAPCYVYLLEPFGLPRWARYTDPSLGVRLPRSPKGIPVVSTVPPVHFTGAPAGAIALPASTGLTGSTINAVCIAACVGGSGPSVQNILFDGETQWPADRYANSPLAGAATGTTSMLWTLAEGTTHPPNAKSLEVVLSTQLVFSGAAAYTLNPIITVRDTALNTFSLPDQSVLAGFFQVPGAQTVPWAVRLRIPVLNYYPALESGGMQVQITWNYNNVSGTTPTFSPGGLNVLGYDL